MVIWIRKKKDDVDAYFKRKVQKENGLQERLQGKVPLCLLVRQNDVLKITGKELVPIYDMEYHVACLFVLVLHRE